MICLIGVNVICLAEHVIHIIYYSYTFSLSKFVVCGSHTIYKTKYISDAASFANCRRHLAGSGRER